MRPHPIPTFLRRLGANAPASFTISLRPTITFERAAVTAQGAEVTAPGLGAETVSLVHAQPNSAEAQRNHG